MKKQRTKEKSDRKILLLVSLLIVLAAALVSRMGDGDGRTTGAYWDDRGVTGKENQSESDGDMPDWITQQFLPVNPYSRPGTPLKKINGLVVHYVGNPGSTGWNNWHYFEGLAESHERKAGSHFIIGLDGTVIQCVPLNELTYCSNSRNKDTISIECCHKREDGKFEDATYESLVKLCRWLMERYDLEAEDVIRHYDVTGKLCPLYFVEHEDAWEAFRDELR